jgi:hypothetical protein
LAPVKYSELVHNGDSSLSARQDLQDYTDFSQLTDEAEKEESAYRKRYWAFCLSSGKAKIS